MTPEAKAREKQVNDLSEIEKQFVKAIHDEPGVEVVRLDVTKYDVPDALYIKVYWKRVESGYRGTTIIEAWKDEK